MIAYVGEFAEGRYITFRNLGPLKEGALTNMYGVWAKTDIHRQNILGRIYWFGRWRKYVFEAMPQMVFDRGCLEEIGEFLDHETRAQMASAKARKKAKKAK